MEEKHKNTLHNNAIQAGGNVHIGDIIYQQVGKYEPPAGGNAFIEEMHELIAGGKTKEAILNLRQFSKDHHPDIHSAALHLANRWETHERSSMMGILSNSEKNVERAQITAGLLDLIGKLRES